MIDAIRLRRTASSGVSLENLKAKEYRTILLLALAHIPLGILFYNAGVLSLVHQVAILAFGLYCAIQPRVKLEGVAVVVAYIIGAEILWRMVGISVSWELGKFGSSMILVAALVRRRVDRFPALPVLYFLALLPACILTLLVENSEMAKDILSSNMSGPLFLLVSCVFFANVQVTAVSIRRMIAAILLPLISVGFITLFYTFSAPEIEFTGESNFATSGGFGPNQVSSMLGLGAFCALLYLVIFRSSMREKLVVGMVALFMAAQSVMTFSRGGIYNAVGAIIVTSLVLLRDPSTAMRRLVPVMLAGLVFLALVFPYMDEFTGGSLSERFEDTQGTSRIEIAQADLGIFFENPIIGAGVGAAYDLREAYLDRKAMSHTEFTRLLSEHGSFGVLALLALLGMAVGNFYRQRTIFGRAFVAGVAVWASLFMVNAGMRLAAPSFMWGLTFLTIINGRGDLKRSKRHVFRRRRSMPEADEDKGE